MRGREITGILGEYELRSEIGNIEDYMDFHISK
jgi:hypothetical protein